MLLDFVTGVSINCITVSSLGSEGSREGEKPVTILLSAVGDAWRNSRYVKREAERAGCYHSTT